MHLMLWSNTNEHHSYIFILKGMCEVYSTPFKSKSKFGYEITLLFLSFTFPYESAHYNEAKG